jgi:hypothetical protein
VLALAQASSQATHSIMLNVDGSLLSACLTFQIPCLHPWHFKLYPGINMRVFKHWKQFAIYDNEKQGGAAREQFLIMLLHQEERMLT